MGGSCPMNGEDAMLLKQSLGKGGVRLRADYQIGRAHV